MEFARVTMREFILKWALKDRVGDTDNGDWRSSQRSQDE